MNPHIKAIHTSLKVSIALAIKPNYVYTINEVAKQIDQSRQVVRHATRELVEDGFLWQTDDYWPTYFQLANTATRTLAFRARTLEDKFSLPISTYIGQRTTHRDAFHRAKLLFFLGQNQQCRPHELASQGFCTDVPYRLEEKGILGRNSSGFYLEKPGLCCYRTILL
ncbi:MAG: hypothetical protein ACMXYF_04375 [Candidatus Woesearchaeota archaeon]